MEDFDAGAREGRHMRLIVYLNLLILAISLGSLLASFSDDGHAKTDFKAFYTGWRIVYEGDGGRLYDLDFQRQRQTEIMAEDGYAPSDFIYPFLPWINPPHAAVPMFVLARFPRTVAFRIFLLINLSALVLSVSILRKPPISTPTPAITAVVALTPVLFILLTGTLSLLCLLFLLLSFKALEEGRDSSAAVWLALCTIKPQIALLPLIVLCVARGWPVLRACALTLGAWLLLTLPFTGVRAWLAYPAALRRVAGSTPQEVGADPAMMANLRGMLAALFGREQWVGVVALAALLAGGIFVVWAARKYETREAFLFAVVLGLLVMPHSNPQDAVVAALPAVVLLRRPGRRRLALLFLMSPLLSWAEYFFVLPRAGARVTSALLLVLAFVALRAMSAAAARSDASDRGELKAARALAPTRRASPDVSPADTA